MKTYNYSLHGIAIRSEAEFPQLNEIANDNFDIYVRFDEIELPSSVHQGRGMKFKIEGENLFWQNDVFGRYHTVGQREIRIQQFYGSDYLEFIQPIIGVLLGYMSAARGRLVLHGNSIKIGEQVVILAGDKGRGKSTLAAELMMRGHSLVADDISNIVFKAAQPYTLPGRRGVKLWDSSIKNLGINPKKLSTLFENSPKKVLEDSTPLSEGPIPLRAIVLLNFGDNIKLTQNLTGNGIIDLLGVRFFTTIPDKLPTCIEKNDFKHTTQLVKNEYLYSLIRPHDTTLISNTADLIEKEFLTRK
jgi:hypothetical protein